MISHEPGLFTGRLKEFFSEYYLPLPLDFILCLPPTASIWLGSAGSMSQCILGESIPALAGLRRSPRMRPQMRAGLFKGRGR